MNELTIAKYLNQDAVSSNIQSVLKDRTPQFISAVVSLVNNDSKFLNVDKKSILNACLIAAALDLSINPNMGQAYVIPYGGVAQLQIGWKGFIQLAHRTKSFKRINVSDVKEGEYLGINRLTGDLDFEWKSDLERDLLPTVGYVGYFSLLDGFEKAFYMTEAQIKKHGIRFSQTYKKGFGQWKDDFDSMARKTVIKLLLSKFAPLSTEMAKAIEADQAVITSEGEYEYLDNKKQSADEIATEKENARIQKHINDAKTLEELEECKSAVYDSQNDDLVGKFIDKQITLSSKDEE